MDVAESAARQLDFDVDRTAPVSLTEQVAMGLQRAIQSGALRVGERLPGVRELADELGVSYVVANQAVRRLAQAGLVVARRKTGIHVAPVRERVWRAHALWLTPSSPSYYFAARQDSLLAALDAADIRCTTAFAADDDGTAALKLLRAALETMSLSVVVCSVAVAGIAAECHRRQVPLVLCGASEDCQAAGCLLTSSRQALRELAAHCGELGVTRPAILSALPDQATVAAEVLAAAGLKPERVSIDGCWRQGEGRVEQIEQVGYDATAQLVDGGALPELLYVTDDYLARGCLTALLQRGIRIPEDLSLAIAGNRRHLPAFDGRFTRIEQDPTAVGRSLAEVVQAVLGGAESQPVVRRVDGRFIRGDTTAPLPGLSMSSIPTT